jgi:hypothetical protein
MMLANAWRQAITLGITHLALNPKQLFCVGRVPEQQTFTFVRPATRQIQNCDKREYSATVKVRSSTDIF